MLKSSCGVLCVCGEWKLVVAPVLWPWVSQVGGGGWFVTLVVWVCGLLCWELAVVGVGLAFYF